MYPHFGLDPEKGQSNPLRPSQPPFFSRSMRGMAWFFKTARDWAPYSRDHCELLEAGWRRFQGQAGGGGPARAWSGGERGAPLKVCVAVCVAVCVCVSGVFRVCFGWVGVFFGAFPFLFLAGGMFPFLVGRAGNLQRTQDLETNREA